VVFVTAPLAYLLFNLNIIYSSASLIVSYALPHLFLAIYVGSRMNGRYRYSFWGKSTTLCWPSTGAADAGDDDFPQTRQIQRDR
jgi:hypothetical protein